MPHQTEPNVNNALGDLLRSMLPGSQVYSENTQVIRDLAGRKPDILIAARGRAPVVVEAEVMPAAEAELDAKSRLGLMVDASGKVIEAAIALRYPTEVRTAGDFPSFLRGASMSWCVFTQPKEGVLDRFPQSGWLEGGVEHLADLVRLVSLPQRAVDQATEAMQQGIEDAARRLDEMDPTRAGITMALATVLRMENSPQTLRMACAILANAMVFHERIAGMHAQIKPLIQVCGDDVANPQEETVGAWNAILAINYWPIFAVAKDLLTQLTSRDAAQALRRLRDTAQTIEATGIDNAHDLTGRIFQRLIADRKYLATFYTLPASAALLARLAVAKMDGVDWSDAEALGKLRIADFACGTGALLSAVYEQIAARHDRAGGDSATLHPMMMEEVLYGCDVMPSAIHVTGSTLSGLEPAVLFNGSHLYTMPYGRMQDNSVMIGSLELLQSSNVLTLFNTSDPALRTGSAGEETAAYIIADIPDEGFDLVIMNPPFTRATNHEGAHADITNPAFAAFDATRDDQTAMGDRINQLGKDSCYHGNAGIASAFAALAHRKLRPGGVLALVLPLSAAAGLSWRGFREMLAGEYTDLMVLSIAANDREMSFSSDTGMAECLVIARKLKAGESSGKRTFFWSLSHRPQAFVHASSLASKVIDSNTVRRIEDGPYGGTRLMIGEDFAGETITAPCASDGEAWGAVRLSDYAVAQTAFALSQSRLWLPGSREHLELRTTLLGTVGKLGLVDRDITGPAPRGPFDQGVGQPNRHLSRPVEP